MSELYFIYGPPGTGKTTTLARHAQRAAETHGPEAVAIASLTRAAAAEIAGRDTGIPDANVGTLHAHCYRALDRPELAETPEGLRAWNETHPQAALTRGANQLEDTVAGDGAQTAGDDLHHQVMTNRARMLPREAWTQQQLEHDALWCDFKRQTGRMDFTDLIETCIRETPTHPAVPQVMLLDEAQDFSRLELALAVTWARETATTVMVGDPLQAIYSWRGADPDALSELPLTGTRTLAQSYRIPHSVHSLATRWIHTGIPDIDARGYAGYAARDAQGHAQRQIGMSLHSAHRLAEHAAMQTEDGTVMVLASCRYMLAPLLAELRHAGVPFHNPYRANDGSWNPMRAANRLKAFLRPDDRVWGEHARSWTWDDLRLFTEPLQARGNLARGAKALIESKCRPDRFSDSQAHHTVELETLAELFGAAAPEHPAYRLDVDWYESQLRAPARKPLAYPLEILRRRGPEALRERPKLIVGTIHSTKGGEADHVLVAPDLSVAGYWQGWHPGGPGREAIVRMLYVAITRARETVSILDPAGADHVPVELLEVGEEAIAA